LEAKKFEEMLAKNKRHELVDIAFLSAYELASIMKLAALYAKHSNRKLKENAIDLKSAIERSLPRKADSSFIRQLIKRADKCPDQTKFYCDLFYKMLEEANRQKIEKEVFAKLIALLVEGFFVGEYYDHYRIVMGLVMLQIENPSCVAFFNSIILKAESDQAVANQLKYWLHFFAIYNLNVRPADFSLNLIIGDIYDKGAELLENPPHKQRLALPVFVQEQNIPTLDRIGNEMKEILLPEDRKIFELWLMFFSDKLDELADKLWQEIVTERTYAILPELDKVTISLPVLSDALGIKKITFLRSSQPAPAVRFRCEFELFGQTGKFENGLEENGCLAKPSQYLAKDIQKYFRFVIVHSYYMILVKDEQDDFEEEKEPVTSRKNEPRKVWIRPFLRKLPKGWKASEEAKLAAWELFGELPPNRTFVHEFTRGKGSISDKPLFDYSLKNLQKTFENHKEAI